MTGLMRKDKEAVKVMVGNAGKEIERSERGMNRPRRAAAADAIWRTCVILDS